MGPTRKRPQNCFNHCFSYNECDLFLTSASDGLWRCPSGLWRRPASGGLLAASWRPPGGLLAASGGFLAVCGSRARRRAQPYSNRQYCNPVSVLTGGVEDAHAFCCCLPFLFLTLYGQAFKNTLWLVKNTCCLMIRLACQKNVCFSATTC